MIPLFGLFYRLENVQNKKLRGEKTKTTEKEEEHYFVNKTLLFLCVAIAKLGAAFIWSLETDIFKMWIILLRHLNLDYRVAVEKYLPLESDVEKVEFCLAGYTFPATGRKNMFFLC